LNYVPARSILRPFPKGGRAGGAGRVNTLVIFTITVAGLARVRQRLAGLDVDRQTIDAPRLGLADSLGSSARLADNG
jgi:hypothetical protein